MGTRLPPLYQWPKPTEALELPGLIRTLNLWKPAGEIVLNAEGGGSAITAGGIVYLPVPKFKCIITGWTMIGDNAGGSTVVDIWKTAYPTVPTIANSITAAAKPTLAAQQVNRATDVPTWTDETIEEDDILAFYIVSNSLNTRVTLSVSIARGDYR
jgi:hypothetical protein